MGIFDEVKEIIRGEEREDSKWKLGDALLKVLGPPPETGVNDGSRELMQRLVTELEEEGIARYSTMYLSQMRQVSNSFPGKTRVFPLPWTCYREAGTPEMLEKIQARADEARVNRLTASYIMQTRRQIEKEEHVPTKAEVHMAILGLTAYLAEVRLKVRKLRQELPRGYMDNDDLLEESEALMETGNELITHGNEAGGITKPQLTVVGGHDA